jgi:hypothetical protein
VGVGEALRALTGSPAEVAAPPVRVPASSVPAAAGRVDNLGDEVAGQRLEYPDQFMATHQIDGQRLRPVHRPEQRPGHAGHRLTVWRPGDKAQSGARLIPPREGRGDIHTAEQRRGSGGVQATRGGFAARRGGLGWDSSLSTRIQSLSRSAPAPAISAVRPGTASSSTRRHLMHRQASSVTTAVVFPRDRVCPCCPSSQSHPPHRASRHTLAVGPRRGIRMR